MNHPVNPTEFIPAPLVSKTIGAEVVLISELNQRTNSFKFRAAWNVVQNIDVSHFIAASSGNFGQALAAACQLHKRDCTIIMPTTSARVKIDAVKGYNATVVMVDTSKQSRADKVAEIHARYPSAHIASAYDCEWVIKGNASLGREIASSNYAFDRVVCPVGGGGLSSGIITGLCELGSQIPVWGAEPLMANDAACSLRQNTLIRHDIEPQTLADGARTLSLGQRNFEVLKNGMPEIVEVSEDNIVRGLQLLAKEGLKVEPTGALSIGALLTSPQHFSSLKIGCVLSGANVDSDLYHQLMTQTFVD
jgi:threonine dehydratase